MKEDSTAIPKDNEMATYMTGIELRQGEEVLFRGGVFAQDEYRWLYNENGGLEIPVGTSNGMNGIILDENGNEIDPMEPFAENILDLMAGPELTHNGDWLMWFIAVLGCIVNALGILFADELFRWQLSFQIRNVDRAEPSNWELTGRYIGWVSGAIMILVLFVIGLQ